MAKKKLLIKGTDLGIEKAEKALLRLGLKTKANFARVKRLSRSTVTNVFAQIPIQPEQFETICEELSLAWREVADLSNGVEFKLVNEQDDSSSKLSLPIQIPQNLPLSGVAKFVGRKEELQTLDNQLQSNDQVALSAIAGMGGVGKTELAIQYGIHHRLDYPGGIALRICVRTLF